MRLKRFFFCVFLVLTFSLFSQQAANYFLVDSFASLNPEPSERALLDSILKLYHREKSDTVKLRLLNSYVEQSEDDKIWIKYNELVLLNSSALLESKNPLSEREIFVLKRFKANALSNNGFYELNIGNTDTALFYFKRALRIAEEIKDNEGIANASSNIGYIYKSRGDVYRALEYYFISLKINEKINNKFGIANTQNNIGVIYKNQGDAAKALEFYEKSLALRKELGDKKGMSASLNNIGYIYNSKADYDKALEYYEKCLQLDIETGEKSGQATSLNNIGLIYEQKNNYATALEHFQKSLALNENIGNKKGEGESLNFLANVYLRLNKFETALQYGKRSLAIAQEIGYPNNIGNSAELLSSLYERTGDFKEALKMNRLSIQMRDSLRNVETEKASLKLQLMYDFDKQKAVNEAEHKNAIALTEAGKKRQKIITFSVAFVLLLALIFGIIVLNRYRFSQKQKNIIEDQKQIVDLAFDQLSEKNKEIVDSIRYAKRIQVALLKEEEHISSHLPEHFVLFKPKDIVSGDFYWSNERDNYWYIAVADCTGHGVPGAFLTMLGTAYLNEIVSGTALPSPANILEHLREKILKELGHMDDHVHSPGQEVKEKITLNDGMDISLLRLNLETFEAEWAGANNPLWIFKSAVPPEESWTEIKANKQPIGQYPFPVPFTNHTFKFEKGDAVYLFSDGFADQFGGPQGKKLKYRALQQKLAECKDEILSSQKQKLNELFENWKGKLDQVDDVCLIGVRV
jgi:tetratricopeptide (TPR) repeat protein/serine phosphatase RsbU (regulator of sigma subunit)